ncbi:MAG: hypothetical protein H0U75_12935 [Legionella sp.]|nr:hypothetical protein [Legionella sp.]
MWDWLKNLITTVWKWLKKTRTSERVNIIDSFDGDFVSPEFKKLSKEPDYKNKRWMSWLIEEIKKHAHDREFIAIKFICLNFSMKDLACFDVTYALDIFQNPKLRPLLPALEIVEIYRHYIKDPKFITALNSKTIPSLPDILWGALKRRDEAGIQKIREILDNNPDLKQHFQNQEITEHSKHPDWLIQPLLLNRMKGNSIKLLSHSEASSQGFFSDSLRLVKTGISPSIQQDFKGVSRA